MIFARILFLLCLFITGCTAQNFKEPASIGQEHKYAPPQPESWKLDNGLTVMFLPDHELPLVSGFLFIKGGSLWESHHEKGVVSALGAQLRSGGAGNLDPLELDEKLSGLAAQVSSGFGAEFGNITFSSMASDLDQVFSIFSDVVLRPRFDNGRLDLWRKQVIDSIERRRDDPGTVARIAFDRITYGNTPYGWSLESRDVKKIDRASLKRMYEKLIYPDQAILGITGDLSKAAA
ncbi:MAG: insulinase family protein, partial [Bdellovibrionales bacterium]|nr:insulinase family protein [Bdellovibrionales bacterium]